jgi:hypothetical protein
MVESLKTAVQQSAGQAVTRLSEIAPSVIAPPNPTDPTAPATGEPGTGTTEPTQPAEGEAPATGEPAEGEEQADPNAPTGELEQIPADDQFPADQSPDPSETGPDNTEEAGR